MTDRSPEERGPAIGALRIGQRIMTLLVSMAETRLRLAVVELEEEKNHLIQLLMMAGITLLFTAFGLMTLLILIFLAVDPAYRLTALAITAAILLGLALIGVIWTLSKARRSTLLGASRRQLAIDRELLEDKRK
ncbi:phage holin family protein [Enterobacillus tribolii]|uniref:Putative membrane protein YqjE n=1 Tax=Enterobacillus tribolii TaxID=1487935 RepID=A0A370R2C0_9GAMM|nr:phage holin family protein [Enterobacillus tribolii]MBW7982732.1 hypothetical protein [Enterobacillus tribolii]RDK95706.1 putative membrane protein YqjE [Enterobacillus tribolii]